MRRPGTSRTIFPYAWVLSFVIGAVVMVMLLVLLYRFVPNRTFSMRDVLPGALLAGVLIEALSLGFPLYARFAGSFNTYGAQFGLFFVLATWLYLLSQLLLLGAVYNRFRLGQPATKGLIASPAEQSRATERPVDVIKRKKKAGAAKSAQSDDSIEPQPATSIDASLDVSAGGAGCARRPGGGGRASSGAGGVRQKLIAHSGSVHRAPVGVTPMSGLHLSWIGRRAADD